VSARFIGPSNKPYVDALASLGGAVNLFNQNPDTAKDQLSTAVSLAKQAVLQTTQPFNVNAQPNTAKIVVGLLNSPIQCIVPPPPPGLPGTMCAMVGKFPFVQLTKTQASRNLTNNEQASLEEVNAMLAPNTGTLWTYYNQNLKQWLVPQGTGYALGPNAEGHVGPAFLSFFNKLARISSALYPSGAPVAGFSFTLRAIPSKGIENATLVVDDQRIPDGSSVQQFKWNAALAHTASLTYNSAEALRRQGTWALFQLVASARVTRTATGVDLIFPVEVSGQTLTFKDGTEEVVHFEISGPGAEVLAPGALPGLPCVTSVVK
jgi:type VI secretion system protein ImpL